MLFDNHNRPINYVRLAVTDRCNLRCFYCMPEQGIKYVEQKALLQYEEMERIIQIMAREGVHKVRITGGEPFLRKGMFEFLERLSRIQGLDKIHITTNGTLTSGKVKDLKRIGISGVNLSLDSVDKERFHKITRRDQFDTVMSTLEELLSNGIPTKVNCVVMNGQNIDDIIPMVELAKNQPVDIRFIEEMPFNGGDGQQTTLLWDFDKILSHIKEAFPSIEKIKDPKFSTSLNYHIPGFQGHIGIIAAYSRLFCGSCNRIRITPQGQIKTCLYDDGIFNIKNILRQGATDEELLVAIKSAISNRAKDGFEAENNRSARVSESMASIGG